MIAIYIYVLARIIVHFICHRKMRVKKKIFLSKESMNGFVIDYERKIIHLGYSIFHIEVKNVM